METRKLIDYLQTVYDWEETAYQQNALIQRIEQKISMLGLIPEPKKPDLFRPGSRSELIPAITFGCLSFGFLILVVGCVMRDYFESALVFEIAGVLLGIGALLGLCIALRAVNVNKAYKQEYAQYLDELQLENREKDSLQYQLARLEKDLEQSKIHLESLYDEGIIYPKYRSLIPVSSFLDYLKSTRCVELGGSDGAYNIYELESRLDIIITRLDRILSMLHQISAQLAEHQYTLYQAIERSNQQNERLYAAVENLSRSTAEKALTEQRQLQEIARNTEWAAYETELARKEAELRSHMRSRGYRA